ncbi:MAG: peptidase S10 [Proteobacteria bacterium]|nr:MAG: peptidase S10 [Pseudomonadota bacterium]
MTRMTRTSRVTLLSVAVLLAANAATSRAVRAQDKEKETKPAENPPGPPPKEESSVTEHSIKIGGQTIPYKATAATTLLKNEKDEPIALLYSTSYTRTDLKDPSQRPLAFLYNGGPGASSIWVHMGAYGPRRVASVDVGGGIAPPYKLVDNNESLLDKADLVFVDPIGTGFSHAVGKSQDKDFWGVDQDVKSLAQFIQIYITRNNRWNSPKFLIGESYGTFRSAALGNYLQSRNSIYLNGIVLMSSVLNLGTISFSPGEDMPYVFYLPSYAASAWYHKMLKERPDNLNAFLDEARRFAATEYVAALMKGDRLSDAEKSEMAKKLSRFTGLSEDYLIKANLRVKLPQFMQELQRSKGLTTGRFDARFSGPTFDLLGEYAQYDPQDTAIGGAFVAVFNAYVREELKFGQDKTYIPEADISDWDWKHKGPGEDFGFPGSPNVLGDLAQALLTNSRFKVEVENGLYDLATPFFGTEHTMDHLQLPEKLRGNIQLKYYDAGHMMYVRDDERAKLKNNVGSFIEYASRP